MESKAQRDHVGRFRPGGPGGPGRPRNGVRAALARIVDFDQLAAYVYSVALDEDAPARDRQWACEFIANYLEGKPVSTIAVSAQVAATPKLPDNWDQLDYPARMAWLEDFKARGALALAATSGAENIDP